MDGGPLEKLLLPVIILKSRDVCQGVWRTGCQIFHEKTIDIYVYIYMYIYIYITFQLISIIIKTRKCTKQLLMFRFCSPRLVTGEESHVGS